MTITSLQHPTIKVGTGKKAKKQICLELQFSGPVNGAGSLGLYVLESGKTKKHKTTYTTRVRLTSAAYNYLGTPPNTVTLFLKSKPKLSAPEQLTVNAGADHRFLRPPARQWQRNDSVGHAIQSRQPKVMKSP